MSKYIAGAVVAFDLRTRQVKWQQHLDLSSDQTQYRAYIYSAPTVADIDRDGKMEIIVGTSVVSPSASQPRIPNIAVPTCNLDHHSGMGGVSRAASPVS